MERRKALAVAAAGALLSASGVVAAASGVLHGADHATLTDAAASTVAATPLESTTSLAPVVVTETRDVYDTVVVPSQVTPSAPVAGAAEPAPGTMVAVGASPQPVGSVPTTTTVPPTTATTRPPGVPADWPADRPIPPMPPGCEQPQLEDNGTWNCDH